MKWTLIALSFFSITSAWAQDIDNLIDLSSETGEISAGLHVQAMDKLSTKILVPIKNNLTSSTPMPVNDLVTVSQNVNDLYKNADYALQYYKTTSASLEEELTALQNKCKLPVKSPVVVEKEIEAGLYVQAMDKLFVKITKPTSTLNSSINNKQAMGIENLKKLNQDVTDLYKNADYSIDYYKQKKVNLEESIASTKSSCITTDGERSGATKESPVKSQPSPTQGSKAKNN